MIVRVALARDELVGEAMAAHVGAGSYAVTIRGHCGWTRSLLSAAKVLRLGGVSSWL